MELTQTPTDDEVIAAHEAAAKDRAATRAVEIKTATAAAIRKLAELRAKEPDPDDLFLAGDEDGPFRGVFRRPTLQVWKDFQNEVRSEAQRPLAGQNLVMKCIVWPAREDLAAAAQKRPALMGVLSGIMAVEAGSGSAGWTSK